MPLYELLCLAKPVLPKAVAGAILQRVGQTVFKHGGVVTGVRSYGEQYLAYDLKKPFQRYDKALIMQMDFMLRADALEELHQQLKMNENVLRWVLMRRINEAAYASQQIQLFGSGDHQELELPDRVGSSL